MRIELKNGEVLEDLERDNLKIVQDASLYKFSSDSVLLSDFAKIKKNESVVELCSGSGVVSVLVFAKCHPGNILGFEVDKRLFDMSQKTLLYNEIKDIQFFNDNLKNAPKIVGLEKTDVVICNPPYYILPKDISKISEKFLTAKYESSATLSDILTASSQLLRFKGKLFLVYTASRLQELLFEAEKNNLVCKNLKFVFKKNKAELLLAKFVKKGLYGCEVEMTCGN